MSNQSDIIQTPTMSGAKQTVDDEPASLLSLPAPILDQILKYTWSSQLHSVSTVVAVSQTCRQLRAHLDESEYNWKGALRGRGVGIPGTFAGAQRSSDGSRSQAQAQESQSGHGDHDVTTSRAWRETVDLWQQGRQVQVVADLPLIVNGREADDHSQAFLEAAGGLPSILSRPPPSQHGQAYHPSLTAREMALLLAAHERDCMTCKAACLRSARNYLSDAELLGRHTPTQRRSTLRASTATTDDDDDDRHRTWPREILRELGANWGYSTFAEANALRCLSPQEAASAAVRVVRPHAGYPSLGFCGPFARERAAVKSELLTQPTLTKVNFACFLAHVIIDVETVETRPSGQMKFVGVPAKILVFLGNFDVYNPTGVTLGDFHNRLMAWLYEPLSESEKWAIAADTDQRIAEQGIPQFPHMPLFSSVPFDLMRCKPARRSDLIPSSW